MKYHHITIEREFASGGSEVGKLLSQKLGIPVYGREILEMAAKMGHVTPEYIEHLEEASTNSLLYSLVMMGKTAAGQAAELSNTDALNLAEAKIIEGLASKGSCIIVGRCAGWVLRNRNDVLNVFIHGNEGFRRERAHQEYGIPEEMVERTLRRVDRRRANFYHANTGNSWQERAGYHMVLDSSLLGTKLCADLIETAFQDA